MTDTLSALGASVASRGGLALDPGEDAAGRNEPADAEAETAGLLREYLSQRAASIYGGSNEIQHNIVSKARFGFQ